MTEDVAVEREIVVFRVRRDARCSECGDELWSSSLLRLEQHEPLCLACADLDQLEFLPSGDAALTRRAKKRSSIFAVVVEWSRSRKRYERQGVLVEPEALRQAEEECLADAELRARRRSLDAARRETQDETYVTAFAAAIRSNYPRCPAAEATRIAEHACRRYSGRVGRTAAAKSSDPEAVRLAVIAHVRHVHTPYDRLLGQLVDRRDAREQVRDQVDAVLSAWAKRAK